MKKRILPALLALTLCLSLLPGALAAGRSATLEEKAQVLAALEIMVGDENGDLRLSEPVTRAQFTKMIVAASPYRDSVSASTRVSPYPDVPYTHWAAPYVEVAVKGGYVNGFLDGTFHPEEKITLVMGVTMAVRLLGYSDADFSAGLWGSGQLELYRSQGLDEGISLTREDLMTRQDALLLFYNLLTAKTKQGATFLTTLGHSLTLSGEIDRVALVNSTLKGPVLAVEGWEALPGFDLATATVYRGGQETSLAAIQDKDVLYWSEPLRTVWAYSSKVSGQIQTLTPSAAAPTAVTVAGRSYSIETADAAYALSALGPYQVGDMVTLLLGRTGAVAAVLSPGEVSSSVCGVVTALTDSTYPDADGNRYTAKTLTLTATDGSSRSYPVESGANWKSGDLVQVTLSGNQVQVSRLSHAPVTGRVDADGSRVGTVPFAREVEILDVSGSNALRVYPARLGGALLEEKDVSYARKNAAGEIDLLILKDFTGDMLSYGILTEVQEQEIPSLTGLSSLTGTYTYDVQGISYTYVLRNGFFNLEAGPVSIDGSLMAPTRMRKLTAAKLTDLEPLSARTEAGSTLPVWESAVVYERVRGDYLLSSLERVRTGYTLTGYYDATPENGGRLRIIIAVSQN